MVQRYGGMIVLFIGLAAVNDSLLVADAPSDQVLVEAESFEKRGGWVLDTQFIETMGSPYLLAHGLGRPVADAVTRVALPQPGTYRVFVRTKDWVARWKASGQPGRFQVLVNDRPLAPTFGTQGSDWSWHDGGTVRVDSASIKVALHDLTGFEGRCDSLLFSRDPEFTPPNDSSILPTWRRRLLQLPDEPESRKDYDLVVIGGGYPGIAASLSAARMGCRVALIQNRPVLGGNGSSEVRVWANGLVRRGEFPRIGEIVDEFADDAKKSPGTREEFGDDLKESIVRAEKNIDLFLNHHAYAVAMQGQRIISVDVLETRSSRRLRISGRLFADCTGHGTIGALAGADFEMTPTGRMGMSNMWAWNELEHDVDFPETPWALELEMKDFPYPRDHHGQWFWESGFDKDPIGDAEAIRDWNFRAVYGAFNAMKNGDGRSEHRRATLTWLAYIGGPRESRRLLGDVILTKEDVVSKRKFPDGVVPSTWSIDLHYPKKQFSARYPDNPFISIAKFDARVDRRYGYPVPYRCFYSRNLDNLFMAGRNISETHEALGTTRVMKTGGMMGEVVGKAASLSTLHECWPRDVYSHYLEDLKELLALPGKARRSSVNDPVVMPEEIPVARAEGPPTGIDPESLEGVVVDDLLAMKTGKWHDGTGLKGYVAYGYLYASPGSKAKIEFTATLPADGTYDVRIAYREHKNRGTQVPVEVEAGEQKLSARIDMSERPPLPHGFISIGKIIGTTGQKVRVTVSTEDAGGVTHADAVQCVPVK